jgi:two-component system nitrate/nitrite response regulator NarL
MMMINLVLGDDHVVFVDALDAVLTQQGFDVQAVVSKATAVVRTVEAVRPEVCVLDRHFADGDGVDLVSEIVAAGTGTKVLMLTADHDGDAVVRALESGASGYVHKSRGVASLTAAIRRVAAGEIVVDVPAWRGPKRSVETTDAYRLAAHLTARERECLALLVEGLGTTAMVKRLGVSATTVRTHVQSLLTKLGVHSRLEAASFAVRHALLDAASAPRMAGRFG